MPVSVEFQSVSKRFGETVALDHVSLRIEPGELFFLLGPSGCGKTTLLRSLAGFHEPDGGRILLDGADITALPPHRRDTGMVFQSYALWPHMTVAENVAFGLEMRKVPRSEIRRRVAEALALVRMDAQAARKPNQLSGGQQQRVALARALVVHPRCLLLDEPLSNLDAKLRLEMRTEIRRICKEAGLTSIYVTHDQKEALSIADRLAVMRAGRLEQVGSPLDVYRAPRSEFVANFIGEANFLDGRVASRDGGLLVCETPAGRLAVADARPAPSRPEGRGEGAASAIRLCIRPESIRFSAPPAGAPNVLRGTLRDTVYLGEVAQHCFETAGGTALKAFEFNPRRIARDAAVEATAWIDPADIVVVEADR